MQQEVLFAVIVGIAVKVLLIPAYKSTDYEVHRNWLAITYSKPLSEWYFENTSQWTLDYPPMFAYFEWLLSQMAVFFDPNMVKVEALEYLSDASVVFQRLSVILSESVLVYATTRWCDLLGNSNREQEKRVVNAFLAANLLVNAGLIIVDNIHFQYNGFLFGVLLLSFAAVYERAYLRGAFWFAVLLTLKHIFMYVAPAYVLFLLRVYCTRKSANNAHAKALRTAKRLALHKLEKAKQKAKVAELAETELCDELKAALHSSNAVNLGNCFKLFSVLLLVFSAAFGPFLCVGGLQQMQQILSRLFPFRRGLSHAYWAPNFWTFYNFAEKTVKLLAKQSGVAAVGNSAALTGGLVGDNEFEFLPAVKPWLTFVLTFSAMIPGLIICWKRTTRILEQSNERKSDTELAVQLALRFDRQTVALGNEFLQCVLHCAFSSFLFGWHVHEKAILLCTVPLSLLAVQNLRFASVYYYLTVIGYYSLFPLLFTPLEAAIKVLLLLSHAIICHRLLKTRFQADGKAGALVSWTALLHLVAVPVHYLCFFVLYDHSRFAASLPFVPLMFTSLFCAIGVLLCWLRLFFVSLHDPFAKLDDKLHSE